MLPRCFGFSHGLNENFRRAPLTFLWEYPSPSPCTDNRIASWARLSLFRLIKYRQPDKHPLSFEPTSIGFSEIDVHYSRDGDFGSDQWARKLNNFLPNLCVSLKYANFKDWLETWPRVILLHSFRPGLWIHKSLPCMHLCMEYWGLEFPNSHLQCGARKPTLATHLNMSRWCVQPAALGFVSTFTPILYWSQEWPKRRKTLMLCVGKRWTEGHSRSISNVQGRIVRQPAPKYKLTTRGGCRAARWVPAVWLVGVPRKRRRGNRFWIVVFSQREFHIVVQVSLQRL